MPKLPTLHVKVIYDDNPPPPDAKLYPLGRGVVGWITDDPVEARIYGPHILEEGATK